MTAAAEDAGVILAVHENFRFQAPMRKARQLIASGAIGEPPWARISFWTGYDVYRGKPYLKDEKRFVVLDPVRTFSTWLGSFWERSNEITAETESRNPSVKGEDAATIWPSIPTSKIVSTRPSKPSEVDIH